VCLKNRLPSKRKETVPIIEYNFIGLIICNWTHTKNKQLDNRTDRYDEQTVALVYKRIDESSYKFLLKV